MLKNKVQKLFISIVMAFLFALTCLIPALTMAKASADTPMPRTNTQTQTCDTLHFFSDQSQHIYFCQSLQADGIINSYQFYDWEYGTISQLENYYNNGEYATLRNEYVVFELGDKLSYQVDNPNAVDTVPDWLYVIFSTMKENGCHIMFICGTDEARFVTKNQFLDYVDIHINTDIFDTFIMNIFYRLVQANNGEMNLEDCTFFLDMHFSQDIHQGYKHSWFFYTYFIPYFRSVYRTEIMQDDLSSQELFNGKNIKILCHLEDAVITGPVEDNIFYDPINNSYVGATFNELEPYIENQQLCAIGRTSDDRGYAGQWIQAMVELRDYLGVDLSIYMYEDIPYHFSEYEEPDVYTAGQTTWYYPILEDFLTDQDLTVYNNWGGRCDITHKAIVFGDDGWLVSLCGEDEFWIPGWQLYMSEGDYEYFFEYSDDW